MNIRYGSVCSGVEAASLAWSKLGWKPAFFSEVEPFPSAVLQQRFDATKPIRPLDSLEEGIDDKERKTRRSWAKQIERLPEGGTIPNLGDFRKIRKTDYEGNIDLLVGGTPCQDLSVAGKREGFDGKRSCLALDFVRLAYELECKWFIWENVPGAFSSNGKRDFARLLSLFSGCEVETPRKRFGTAGFVCNARRDRFGLAWRVLDAQFVRTHGFPFAIPQRRRRIFIVGYFGDWRRAATVLFEPERLSWNPPTRFRQKEENSKVIGISSDGTSETDVSFTLDATYYKGVCGRSSTRTLCFVETGKGFYNQQNISGTLEQHEEQHRRNIICFHGSQDTISNTEHANAVNRNNGLENCISDGFSVRRLMPLECERLMGFPDNYTRISFNGKPEEKCPDAPRYKACGNSMCVNVMEWLGRRIEMVEGQEVKDQESEN